MSILRKNPGFESIKQINNILNHSQSYDTCPEFDKNEIDSIKYAPTSMMTL